ncbi:hypothetical protein K1W54_08765 [Micromonospora sp. CPCC 205371]|nr:hypothetical protein [Micromonospora sp. CPCC 205371]
MNPVTVDFAIAISTGAWWLRQRRITQSDGIEKRSWPSGLRRRSTTSPCRDSTRFGRIAKLKIR